MSLIDWRSVRRILVVRLRSIGDTVLTTPSLIALRRFLPEAQIDVMLDTGVASLLEGFDAIDNVIPVEAGFGGRVRAARKIRSEKYNVVFDLHGGTTATFLTYTSGATHRVGFAHYQYSFLYDHVLSTSRDFWQRDRLHSAEQQLALLGAVGVPVDDRPRSRLTVSEGAVRALHGKLTGFGPFALMHPASVFETKQWSAENFAIVADHLASIGIGTVAVAASDESKVLQEVRRSAASPITIFDDLTLAELTALASKASIFIGNDSGVAHIAAAVGTPTVVVFGSSNRDHWYPWTDAPSEMVFNELPCQPCPGYECRVFGKPKCILSIGPGQVIAAVTRVLESSKKGGPQPALVNHP